MGLRLAFVALALVGCGGGVEAVDPAPVPDPVHHRRLSEYGFFAEPLGELRPAEGVLPYTVASPLWADHAEKDRFLVLPEGGHATLGEGGEWDLPVDTVLIKTFSFAGRLIETRLLMHEAEGWTGHTYLWNEEQTEAVRAVAGRRIQVESPDEGAHEYVVPNTNQCGNCHARDDLLHPLGVITGQLNRPVDRDGVEVNQIAWLAERGAFAGEPPDVSTLPAFPEPQSKAPVELRARAYLHANCSHCHRPGGGGGSTGLVLLWDEEEPRQLGVCKSPVAAGAGTGGHDYDVVPGKPDDSIMPFRMGSPDPEIKMPELPNRLPDTVGIALVREWIASMTPAGCP